MTRMWRVVLVVLLLGLPTRAVAQGAPFYQSLAVTSTTAVGITNPVGLTFCRLTLETAPIRWTLSGTAPTFAVGTPAAVNDQIVLNNLQDIASFRAIAVSTSAVLNVSCGSGTSPAISYLQLAPTVTTSSTSALTPTSATTTPAVISVQQSATQLPVCTTASATAAVNNTATLTLTPPAGQSVYLCNWDITHANDATGTVATTNLSFTSTNLNGWAWKYSDVGTANTALVQRFGMVCPGCVVRSAAPGVAVTIVSPAINLHATYSISASYFFK